MSSRTLNDINVGTSVWVPELVGGIDTYVEYYLLKKSENNGILLRKECKQAKRMHSSNNANYPYPDAIVENAGTGTVCEMDKYLSGAFITTTFSQAMQNCLSSETIKYKDFNGVYAEAGTVIDIARRVFLLSYTELGYGGSDEGDSMLPALQTATGATGNGARIGRDVNGNAVGWWLRSVYSSTNFLIVYSGGSASSSSASHAGNWLRPALSVALATSVSPSGETTIRILPDPDKQYTEVEGSTNLGSTQNRPTKGILRVGVDNLYDTDFKICNNTNDDNPAWENCSNGVEHTFSNDTKTATNWGVGFKFYGKSLSAGKLTNPYVLTQEDTE